MNGILSRPSLKTAVAVLTIAGFLAFAQGGVAFTAGPQRRGDFVFVEISLLHLIDLGVTGGIDRFDQVPHPVAVNIVPELDLRLDLVAFGDGHFAHVIAKARDFCTLPIRPPRARYSRVSRV